MCPHFTDGCIRVCACLSTESYHWTYKSSSVSLSACDREPCTTCLHPAREETRDQDLPPVSCCRAHKRSCDVSDATSASADAELRKGWIASVKSQSGLCWNHTWWDRRSDKQPASCRLFHCDLFQGICKVTGFRQGNQLERALVECLTIPPCFPSRWRSLLVIIISFQLLLS